MRKIFLKYKAAIKVVAIVIFYYVLGFLFNITCPIYAIIGIPCPCCGVTRALISILKFDTEAYFSYNAMALPLVFAFFFSLTWKCFKHKRLVMCVIISILTINLIYYILRLYGFLSQTAIFLY